jgi:Trypsin-like peptidase domain
VIARLAAPRSRAALLAFGLLGITLLGASSASALDPESFAEVSSGIVFIKTSNCRGGTRGSGSGFLVGTSVVMTATHVVNGCRTVRVLVKERRWVGVTSRIDWNDRGSQLDVSTLKLTQSLKDVWVFSLRPSQIPTRAYVAALGHPLGEGVSYSNGRVLGHIPRQQIVMRILGAQGMSGGPVVDTNGRVVGVINGLFSNAVGPATGSYTADNLVAYDVSSRWGAWRRTLCHTYTFGGIEDCPNSPTPSPSSNPPQPPPPSSPPPPPPPPPAPPTVSFTDSTNEDPSAPDITSVVVSATTARLVTFQINISNRPSLTQDMFLLIFLDSDRNSSTGDPALLGSDYAIQLVPGAADLFQWNGSDYVPAGSQSSLGFAYASGATIRIATSDLNNSTGFNFGVIAVSGVTFDAAGKANFDNIHRDAAPDAGHGFYTYALA